MLQPQKLPQLQLMSFMALTPDDPTGPGYPQVWPDKDLYPVTAETG